MRPVPILFPFKGNSDAQAFSDQAPETSSECLNARGIDSRTGRRRGSRRAPLQKFCATALNVATKVKDICQVTYDLTKLTYSSIAAGSEETRWSTTTPTKTDTLGVVCDRQANVYALDGNSGIAKYNQDGTLLWKHALPIAHKDHLCRALWVDELDRIYVAVSANGDQATARIWCYTQNDSTTTPVTLFFELTPGAYVERLKVKGDKLWTLQNRPDRGKTDVVAYTNIDTSDPLEAFRRSELSFPGNDFDIGPDGSIFVASEPNANRGIDPKVLDSTPGGEEWTPKELASADKRIFSWHDAKEKNAFFVTRLPGAKDDEGGTIEFWFDKSGKNRHWYKSSVAGEQGPTYRSLGIGGYPSVHFNGSTTAPQAMESALPTSVEKAEKANQLCTIPNYSGAQFALFIVFRAPIEATVRWLLGFDGAVDRGIIVNKTPGTAMTAVAGSVCLFEAAGVAGTAASSATVPPAPTGLNGHPLGGSLGTNGCTVVTWICDGGVHDVFGTATRSTLRVNGYPVDRWQSAEFSATVAARLGKVAAVTAGLSGDVAEILCLSDWEDANGVAQRLITMPEYPDANFAAGSDTEIERIEGYLANRWRIADQLPGGRASYLTTTANFAAADTVTVGATTYTFRAALTPATNEVLIGANEAESLSNLRHAINRTGRPGVDYAATTTTNTSCRALSPMATNATPDYRMAVVNLNPNAAAVATTETSAVAAWNAATTSTSINAAGGNQSFYPHPFYYKRTGSTLSVGGPPRTAGASTISKPLLLNSIYGVLAKIDTATGALRWVATSDYDGVGSGVGGVGYGVIVASTGHIFSVGPRQAAVVSPLPAILADTVDVRKFGDTGATFIISVLAAHDTWEATPGDPTYKYPRLALDQFDNLYVPIFNAAATTSAIVYSKASAAFNGVAVALVTLNNLTSDPQAHAIALDPLVPTYQATTPPNRVEHFILATRNAGVSTFATLYRIRIVSVTQSSGAPRASVALGACGADLKTFAAPNTVATPTGGAAALDSSARFVDSVSLFQKIYLVDGKKTLVFDPVLNTVAELSSDGPSAIPQRCKIVGHYGGRLVLARDPNDPQNWHMSKSGNPRNFDFFPAVQTATQAVKGNLPDGAGRSPDIINTFIRYSDDLAFFGGDRSIQRVTGNPSGLGGGRIDLISDTIGIAWGKAWAKDPEGNLYFFGSRGGIWMLPLGGAPIPISENTIHKRLTEIDLGDYFMRLVWNDSPTQQGLHIFQCPFGAGGTHVKHWFIERRTGGWHEDEYGSDTLTTIQPTAAYVLDGDTEDDRVLVVGCEDGFVRFYDPTASNGDDGNLIESRVMMGPFHVDEAELRFTKLQAVLANDQAGVRYELFASDEPDVPGHAVKSGELEPGVNPIHFVRARGRFVWVRFQQATAGDPWSLESMFMEAHPAGRVRVRAG